GARAERIGTVFSARFDPDLALSPHQRNEREAAIVSDIEARLKNVDSLDEDRIIRHFVNAVQSAVRTNFYQSPSHDPTMLAEKADVARHAIAIKFDSRKVSGIPRPRPRFEIFICSPRFDAVHLRLAP